MEPTGMERIPRAVQPELPWKNGGGTTREVAVAQHVDREGFRWRVSVAQVASDGPFSLYPGIDRTLWLLSGAGMVLDVAGSERRLARRFERLDFPGEARITARLIDGPNEDLNVMVERASTVGETELIALSASTKRRLGSEAARPGVEHLLLVLRGTVTCRIRGEQVELATGDALRWSEGHAVVESGVGASSELLHAAFAPRASR
jgi:environmental stress-induced protein Ves